MKKEYPDILKLEGEKWQNPDPATGKLGTRVPAEWLQTTEDSLKSLTLEMLEVLKSAGINPNELNNTQVRDAIQKMILARVINYNDIVGRPVVKDSLGDDRNNPASQRVVNDVNRAASTAQKTANNAHALAQSKQDKLDFIGDGPEVMKTGAFGIGIFQGQGIDKDITLANRPENGFYRFSAGPGSKAISPPWNNSGDSGLILGWSRNIFNILHMSSNTYRYAIYSKGPYNAGKWTEFYTDHNTTPDKSGFLRASGSANALTESAVTNSLGNSKSLVASQFLTSDVAQKATSAHYRADEAYDLANSKWSPQATTGTGNIARMSEVQKAQQMGLGYGQKWVNMTASRSKYTSYTNNTGKPIQVSIRAHNAIFKVDGVTVSDMNPSGGEGLMCNAIVPHGSTYSLSQANYLGYWAELR